MRDFIKGQRDNGCVRPDVQRGHVQTDVQRRRCQVDLDRQRGATGPGVARIVRHTHA